MIYFHVKVLWVYIVLLLVGGLIGFFKGKSKVSLITSAVFAALLILTTLRSGNARRAINTPRSKINMSTRNAR